MAAARMKPGLSSQYITSTYSVRFRTRSEPLAIMLGERVSAALLLILLLPALLAIAIAIYILSGRSPIVADLRIGTNGHPFWLLKLRTMWPAGGSRPRRFQWIERLATPAARTLKTAVDPRVTSPFAAFCRRHSIDELPQFWHVILGVMSYVGPRPLTAGELAEHYGLDAIEVLSRKPGLSGLWQVAGRSRLNYRQRKRLDLYLVRHSTTKLYFAILRRTATYVVKGKSAW
jgi:exopolysaccharide production protein ExoY